MDYERPLQSELLTLLSRPTPVIQVLIGPRQVGKTTIARRIEKSIGIPAIYATADSPVPLDAAWIETQWRRAVAEGTASGAPVLLILDEVQKVRGWSEILKLLWDNRSAASDIRVMVLGSSALLMQEGLSESLAGRFFLHRCSHWGYQECRDAFGWSLEQWIYFGGYPGAASFADDETSWKRYIVDSLIETVLARDVLQMSKITKPVLLRHLFALAATLPAQSISYTKMLGQLHDAGNTTTLAHYLKLLESAFLISGLELFSRGQQRKRGSSPKLVLWNNALVNALSTKSFADSLGDTIWWGRLVENAVGAYLCNLNSVEYMVTYWRDGDHEVDFVVTRGRDVWAIEVKSGRSGKSSGLARFRSRYPDARPLLVGGQGIPLPEFFGRDASLWFV
ncbi:ATP-binding protein [Geobacter sp.]|uniref:ATP-binding protein n=1 Tax=Geobacter sp. TaxID=46610 RepID=UPI0026232786|nr:ATP-binding protein [Geobacter sp.]